METLCLFHVCETRTKDTQIEFVCSLIIENTNNVIAFKWKTTYAESSTCKCCFCSSAVASYLIFARRQVLTRQCEHEMLEIQFKIYPSAALYDVVFTLQTKFHKRQEYLI